MTPFNIATTYAQALYQIALQQALLSHIYTDICTLLSLYKQNPGFRLFLANPTLTNTYKQHLLHHKLKSYLHNKTLTFLLFIIQKGRYTHIKSIFEAFVNQYKRHNNVQTAHVTTAKALNPTLKQQLITLTTKLTGHTHIELIPHINPTLLGGYILQIDDKQIDTSLATQLKRLRHLILTHHE